MKSVHLPCVTAALSTLSADEIYAYIKALLNVFGVTNHVHIKNAVLVQLLNHMLGRYTFRKLACIWSLLYNHSLLTYGRNKKLSARVDDYLY